MRVLFLLSLLLACAKPPAVPAAPVCYGLDRWQIEGDSVMILRFHILPAPVAKARRSDGKD